MNGRILIRDGLINVKDVEQCLVRGNCKKLFIQLPAWTVLQCLLASAKSNSSGLVISKYIYIYIYIYMYPRKDDLSCANYDFVKNLWQLMVWSLRN